MDNPLEKLHRYTLTMPIQPGIDLVMYVGADEIRHRNWFRYRLYLVVVRAEVVHDGHTIQVERFETKVPTRWTAHTAMQIAEEYVASMRKQMTIVVSE
jgi:hypothetical protein